MAIYNIIQETKYFALKEVRKEIQNILNEGIQDIDKFKLMESINKALNYFLLNISGSIARNW